eukprot:GFYU01024241.1.p1 GENE.GFYU01024241.1~~GFYU01024241.1.p1  ORF type:complete len:123 (+),score=26.17 GFYU01024241.1:566-934(+)
MHGHGTKHYGDGSVYKGEWKADKRHGQGVYTWRRGREYVGEWEEDTMNGEGTMTWTNDKSEWTGTYKGGWVQNKKHGRGLYTWPDHSTFEGEWHFDKVVSEEDGVFQLHEPPMDSEGDGESD